MNNDASYHIITTLCQFTVCIKYNFHSVPSPSRAYLLLLKKIIAFNFNVMISSKMSLNLEKIKPSLTCYCNSMLHFRATLCCKPDQNLIYGSRDIGNLQRKFHTVICYTLSQNQYWRVPTHFARSMITFFFNAQVVIAFLCNY